MTAEIPDAVRRGIAAIRADHRSGSVALTRRAGRLLRSLASSPYGSAEPFLQQLETTCRMLLAAQPSMAAMVNLANTALFAADGVRESHAQRARVESSVAGFLHGIENAGQAICNAAGSLLGNGMTVLTHSASDTVRHLLLEAARAGVTLRVIATESRPLCEGTALARKLGASGIPVTLIVDAAAMQLLPEADLILVGADAITSRSLVNKAGTSLLALAAREHKKAIYALAGSEKFLPRGYDLPPETPKAAAELLSRPAPNVTVRNLYYDATPLSWLQGIVTEQGILKPAGLRSRHIRGTLHPALTGVPLLGDTGGTAVR